MNKWISVIKRWRLWMAVFKVICLFCFSCVVSNTGQWQQKRMLWEGGIRLGKQREKWLNFLLLLLWKIWKAAGKNINRKKHPEVLKVRTMGLVKWMVTQKFNLKVDFIHVCISPEAWAWHTISLLLEWFLPKLMWTLVSAKSSNSKGVELSSYVHRRQTLCPIFS